MSVVATLLVRVAANLTELDKSFSEMERAADRISKAYTKLGGQLQSIGSKLTTSLTLPIAGIGAAATKSFADFDTAMKGVQAAIAPTKAEMLALEAAAMEWGAKTQFSATEAATALGELGKAGIKSADSIELLPSVLNLATVGGIDLASAATLTTDTLTQFGLTAGKASKVNDVLAKSAQVSTTSVAELGNALKYAGPVAGAFGMSIEETGAALAMFANAGFKADMAGTALRGIITEIKTPAKGLRDVMEELKVSTLANADGTVHLVDVLRKLEAAGANSEQVMRAFGDRAGPAMVAALSQGSGALADLNTQMEKSGGTAQAVAETLLSGLGGALEKMRGAVETAGISIGKVLAPAIVYAADLIGSLAEFISGTLVPAFQSMPKAVQVAAGGILGLTAAIGPLVYVGGTLVQSFGAMAGLFAKTAGGAASAAEASAGVTRAFTLQAAATWIATTATTAFTGIMAVLLHPVTLVVLAVGALAIGLRILTGSWEGVLRVLTLGLVDFRTLQNLWTGLKELGQGVADGFLVLKDGIAGAVSAIANDFKPAVESMQTLVNDVGKALRSPFAAALREVNGEASQTADQGVAKLARAMLDLTNRFLIDQAILQFRGQLVAVTYIVQTLVGQIVILTNNLRVTLVAAIQAATQSIDNMLAGMRVVSGWFGVEFPGSIGKAIGALNALGINTGAAGSSYATWMNDLKKGVPTLAQMAQASRDAAYAAEALAYKNEHAAGTFKAYAPGLTQAKSLTELAGISFGSFGDTLTNTLAPGMALVARTSGQVSTGLRGVSEAAKAAAAAAKKARDEMWALYDSMSGQDVINNAFKYMNALVDLRSKGFEPSAKGAEDIRHALEDAAQVFISTGKKVPDYMGRLWASLLPPEQADDKLRNFAGLWDRTLFRQVVPALGHLQGSVDQVLAGIKWESFGDGLEKYLRGAELKAQIADWGTSFGNQINQTMAGMFTGQTGFMDGFRSMFSGVQSFAGDILGSFQQEITNGLQDIMAGGDFDIKELFGGEKSVAAGAAAGASVGMAVGVAFGRSFGKVAGVAMGAVSGALMGGMYGGWAGAAIGAGVGAVSGWFSGMAEEKKQRAAMKQARNEIRATFGTVEDLEVTAKRLGVSMEALWETDDLIRFQGALDHLNIALADEKHRLEELAQGLDKTAESGALLSKELIKAMDTKLPGGTEAIAAFMDSQFKAATAGLDAFLTNTTVKTKEGAAAISGAIAGMYQQMVAGGMAPTAAFAALEPAIAKLQKQMTDAGFAGAEAFGPLADLARLSADAIAGPMFDAMAGLEQGLTATFNMGLLNQDAFAGFTAELLAGYKALEAQGKGGTVAMAGMQGALQKAWELSEDFGYSLGVGEQQLVDYAEQAGLVGDRFRPATDRMANAIDALVDRFDRFLERLSDALPAAAQTAASAVQQAFTNLKMPTVKIPTEILPPDNMPAGASGHQGQYIPALASGAIVSRPTVALIGEAGPEAVVPLSKDFGSSSDLTVYLDSEVITRAVLRKQPRQLRVYGAAR